MSQHKESVSVIIPTLEEAQLETVQSIPEGVETVIVRTGTRAEARNIGAERASGDILVFCDDDIGFETDFFWNAVTQAANGSVVGLRDYEFGLLLTRFMAIRADLFESVDGFNGRMNHMEDTEFSLRCLSAGYSIKRAPRELVAHTEHESAGQGKLSIIKNTLRIVARHPWATARIGRGYVGGNNPGVGTSIHD